MHSRVMITETLPASLDAARARLRFGYETAFYLTLHNAFGNERNPALVPNVYSLQGHMRKQHQHRFGQSSKASSRYTACLCSPHNSSTR